MLKNDLKTRVVVNAREYGIANVLFRHAVGERLGLSATDMECLGAIFFKGFATPSELAQYTGLSTGATTAMIDRLEKAGLIKRQPNPRDRRSTLIRIVPEAAERVGPLFASARQAQDTILTGYNEHELMLLENFFSKMTTMWDQERQKLRSPKS